MPFCPECGKTVAPKAKFCRNCGASQVEDAPTLPPPVTITSSASNVCQNSGTSLLPDEKSCGDCGAKTPGDSAVTAASVAPVLSHPPAPPAPSCSACGTPIGNNTRFCGSCGQTLTAGIQMPPPPPPMAAATGGVRPCRVCGNDIKPGDRFCSRCLAIVTDASPPVVSVAQPVPPVTAPSADLPPYICAACGSPIAGAEKFCGICGAAVVAARLQPVSPPPPVQPVAAPVGKFCGSCGAAVSVTTRFCGGCGAPVGAAAPAPDGCAPSQASVTISGGEEVIGVIANAHKMKMMGMSYDTFNLIVTNRRMIFAQLTQAMVNAAIAEAQAKAKAEGKGFFGIMGDQMAAQFQYARKYEFMAPDAVLAETPGNTAIENGAISAIDLRLLSDNDNASYGEFNMTIKSSAGKAEYRIGEDDRFINILKTAYGDCLHMPRGYFRAGGVKIKIF